MRLAEIVWAHDASVDPTPYFPVLARSPEGRFIVVPLREASESNFVLEISDRDLAQINSDLTSRVSTNQSAYPYFKILARRTEYTDVVLEVPTKGDFWFKSWYRIQNGTIHPRRITRYSPMMAMFVFPLSLLAGVFSLRLCDEITRRIRKAPR